MTDEYTTVEESPLSRRRARIMAWVLVATFILPIVVGLLYTALSSAG